MRHLVVFSALPEQYSFLARQLRAVEIEKGVFTFAFINGFAAVTALFKHPDPLRASRQAEAA